MEDSLAPERMGKTLLAVWTNVQLIAFGALGLVGPYAQSHVELVGQSASARQLDKGRMGDEIAAMPKGCTIRRATTVGAPLIASTMIG